MASHSHRSFVLASPTAYTSLFEQQSKDRSYKQDQVNPPRAPFCTNGPGCKSIPTAEKAQVPTQCLDRTRARKGGLQANLQTLNRKWLGSRQYESNKMFKEAGGAVEVVCALSALSNHDRAVAAPNF